jgi:hypothetical protein
MIVAKSCHDMDVISWLMEQPCVRLSSSGGISHFRPARAPLGAPERCASGCPAGDTCHYNAQRYVEADQRVWLDGVWDGGVDAPDQEILDWLKTSPWGRCVYHCDNTAVDHQVVAMEFANGSTATFTMTAFDSGRNVEIFGTRGVLRGGAAVKRSTGSEITLALHHESSITPVPVESLEGGYHGHGGGDMGLMLRLHDEMRGATLSPMSTSIGRSVQSHVMGFAAEAARLSCQTVELSDFMAQHSLSPNT